MYRKAAFTLLLLIAILSGLVPAALAQGPVPTQPAQTPPKAGGSGTSTGTAEQAQTPVHEQAAAPEPEPAPAQQQPQVIVYTQNFDTNNGGFVASGSNSTWAWGAPTIGAHSAPNVWKTNLTGNYNNYDNSYITSPNINLSGYGACTLGWWQWRELETCCDYTNVDISSNGGTSWTTIQGPLYTSQPSWLQQSYAMSSAYSTASFRVRFHMYSDLSVTYRGYAVDDISIDCAVPAPNLSTSTKSAPVEVVGGDPIPYTIQVINTGTAPANAATMTDPLPTGTTYVAGSVSCTAGTCSYDSGNNQILWNGTLAAGASATITFQADTDGIACGTNVVNTATISDPQDPGGPRTKQATTRVVSVVVPLAQDFEGATFPPSGWTETQVNGTTGDWSRVSSGSSPTALPHGGSWMAMFNGWSASSGHSTRLWTGPMSLGNPTPPLSFWMFHDNDYNYAGNIQVQVSTNGGANWTTLATFNRYNSSGDFWSNHTVDLSAYAGMSGVHIGFLAVSDYWGNMYVDDISIGTVPPWYPCPSVAIGPDSSQKSCALTTVNYVLTVENKYPLTDTLDIAASSIWPATPNPSSITLGPGSSGVVTVTVALPWDASGNSDAATIVATGQGSGLSDSATLTTLGGGGWADAAPAPAPSMDNVVVEYNDELYLLGGYGLTTPAKYDPATNSWTPLAVEPAPHINYVNDACFGLNDVGEPVVVLLNDASSGATTLHRYNITTNAWDTPAVPSPLPANGIWAPDIVSDRANNVCYISGGATTPGAGNLNTIYAYYPDTNTAAALAPMTNVRDFHASWLYNGMVCVGGGNNGSSMNSTQCYDIASNTWAAENATLGPLPYANWGQGDAEQLKDGTLRLWIISGVDPGGNLTAQTSYYDTGLGTWVPGLPVIHPVYRVEGDVLADMVYLVGGSIGGFSPTTYNQRLSECPVPEADITVDPTSLSAAQCPDTATSQPLQICNLNGTAPLNWSIGELTQTLASVPPWQAPESAGVAPHSVSGAANPTVDPAVVPPAPQPESVVLVGQQPNQVNGIFSDANCDMCGSPQVLAENFALEDEATLEQIVLWTGYFPNDVPIDPDVIRVIIHQDASGQPGPVVYDESNVAYERAQTGVVLFGVHEWMHTLTLGTPAALPAGNYWVEIYNATGSGTDDWFWETGNLDPVRGLVGSSFAFEAPGSAWNYDGATDMAFQLIGTLGPQIDVPWLSENPASGQVWLGECETVTVSFDSTGMAPGDYTAGLLVSSDDPDTPTVTVPVTLTVNTLPDAQVTAPPLEAELCPDASTTINFDLCNLGECDLDWELVELTQTLALVPTLPQAPSVPRAGQTVVLSASSDQPANQPTNPPVVNAPVQLILDDGSRDNDIGIGGTWEFIWLNRFTPDPGEFPFELNQVQFYFSTAGLVNVGDDIIIVVYENTSGDPDPAAGSTWLASFPATVQALDTWNVYDLATPVTLAGPGDVLIGAIALETPGSSYFPASMDQTASQQRSWVGAWLSSPPPNPPTLPPDDLWSLIDAYFPGNWMVRGYGQTIEPVDVPWLSEDPIQGSVPYSDCATIAVTFDSTGLQPGVYTAFLRILSNDPAEPEITLPVTLTVDQPVSIVDVVSVTNDLTATFTSDATGTLPIDYLWDFGDGATSTETNPIHTYAAGGCYPVTLDVANGCGLDSWVGQVCVCDPVHDANFTWYPPTPIEGQTVYFTATAAGTGPLSYDWDLGDGTTATGQNVNHVYALAGTYTVVMTATGECGFQVVSYDITVASGCVAPDGVDFSWAPITPTAGATVDFAGTILTGTAPLSFDWAFSDGGTATGQNVSHVFVDPGSYAVTLTVSNDCGEAEVVYTVVVAGTCEPVTGADFDWTPPSPLIGDLVTFNGTAAGTEPLAYAWDFGDGTTGSGATATHTYATAGDYTVVMTATNGCGEQVVEYVVTVYAECLEPGGASFTWTPLLPSPNQAVDFTAGLISGTAPLTYTWDFGDGGTGTGATATHTFIAYGAYTVTLTVANPCGQTAAVEVVTVETPVSTWTVYLPVVFKNAAP